MIYKKESLKSVQEVVDKIQELAPNYKFGVLYIHNIKNTLNSKGFNLANECQVLDICNPNVANKFLQTNMLMSSVMPCKISVFQEDNKTFVAMNSLLTVVKEVNDSLEDIVNETEKVLKQIIEEAI